MKTNKESLQAAMDRRLSFLDDLPSCRPAVRYRIAQEEEPVMKKKTSFVLVFAIVMILLSAAALATGLLISPRVSAARAADQALENTYGVTADMQTFFFREQIELPDGSVQITYAGLGNLEYVLGTYTATVRDGVAEISWSHDREDTSGGYDAEAWGAAQLKQMMTDCLTAEGKQAYISRASAIAEAHDAAYEEDLSSYEAADDYGEWREAQKNKAMEARKLSEDEMIAIGREFITSSYGLDE